MVTFHVEPKKDRERREFCSAWNVEENNHLWPSAQTFRQHSRIRLANWYFEVYMLSFLQIFTFRVGSLRETRAGAYTLDKGDVREDVIWFSSYKGSGSCHVKQLKYRRFRHFERVLMRVFPKLPAFNSLWNSFAISYFHLSCVDFWGICLSNIETYFSGAKPDAWILTSSNQTAASAFESS